MGRFEDMIHGLQEDIEIPKQVLTKYTDTFSQLPDKGERHSHRTIWKNAWVVAAAAVLAVGAASVGAAAYIQWSRSLEEGMQITPEQREELVDNKMLTNYSGSGKSVTQGDVTVTLLDCIVGNYSAFISFKVEGYQPPEGMQPQFAYAYAEVDDDGDGIYGGSESYDFYDGLVSDENGMAAHADGTPVEEGEQSSYVLEDGSMEYQIWLNRDKSDYYIGRPIHVELQDLGYYTGKVSDVEVEAEGTWSFDWTLPGKDMTETYTLDAELGESGAVVQQAELSPLSAVILYDFPKQEMTETGIGADGEETVHTTYVEPPIFAGVRMKDGTVSLLYGGGSLGYTEENPDIFKYMTTFQRVIDVEQVADLLFWKSYSETDTVPAEEEFYIVPLG